MTLPAQPVMSGADPQQPFAWHAGRHVSRSTLFHDVRELAERLADGSHVVNYCRQRYPFTVGFLAAALRAQVTLLPPDATPRTLAHLRRQHPRLSCLTDDRARDGDRDTVVVAPAAEPVRTEAPAPSIPCDRVVAIAFTSGTTGTPTPHEKTFGALQACARSYLGELPLPSVGGSILATVPPQHMYGLESSILVPLFSGLSVHSAHPLFPFDVCAALSELPTPRILVTTPVHLRALLASRQELPALELVVSAAAPLARATARRAESRFRAPVREVYGCTEVGIMATRRTSEQEEWTLAGGISIVNDGGVSYAVSGHAGRVALQDRVEIVSSSTFMLLGRNADLVNVAGKRASFAGLDAILLEIEGIVDGAFFAPPSADEREARLAVAVVAPALTAAEVRKALRGRIDAAFVPRDVYVVDALPRSSAGKLPRDALIALADGRATRKRHA